MSAQKLPRDAGFEQVFRAATRTAHADRIVYSAYSIPPRFRTHEYAAALLERRHATDPDSAADEEMNKAYENYFALRALYLLGAGALFMCDVPCDIVQQQLEHLVGVVEDDPKGSVLRVGHIDDILTQEALAATPFLNEAREVDLICLPGEHPRPFVGDHSRLVAEPTVVGTHILSVLQHSHAGLDAIDTIQTAIGFHRS